MLRIEHIYYKLNCCCDKYYYRKDIYSFLITQFHIVINVARDII